MLKKPWFRVRKSFLFVIVTLLLLVGGLVTQPDPFGPKPNSRPVRVADSNRLREHVRALTSDFGTRSFDHPESLSRAADYIEGQFRSLGLTPTRQSFKIGSNRYRNLIVQIGPPSQDRIVIGAHYDVCNQEGVAPGADDNASGVAGLLELARLLTDHPPQKTVELVAYTLEEPPYFRTSQMGSAVHARSLRAQRATVSAMICLEMIGYFSDEPWSQGFPFPLLRLFYPNTGNFITLVSNLSSIGLLRDVKRAMTGAIEVPVHSMTAPPSLPGVDFSDHLNYWAQGYPAIMVTDTAFFRNHAYHTAQDTADRLDYSRMAQVVSGVFAWVGG